MIGTFMLEGLRGAVDGRDALVHLDLDWAHAMVLVSSRAGTNVSSGLTEGTNWLVALLKAASGFNLPDDRIKIVPYAQMRPSVGQPQLLSADLDYYVQRVWGPLFYRKIVSDQVFASIPTIYLPDRPPLPGDYFVTQAVRDRSVHDPHEAFAARCPRDAVEHGCVLDGWGTGKQALGSERGRYSRPHRRFRARGRRIPRGDAEVAAPGFTNLRPGGRSRSLRDPQGADWLPLWASSQLPLIGIMEL
jgi:hypothetical protein